MNRSAYRRSLIYIFLLAVSVRLVFIFTMQEGFYFGDSVKYSAAAVNLLANGDFGEKVAGVRKRWLGSDPSI